jgi:hypothetical protein
MRSYTVTDERLVGFFANVLPHLNERQRRVAAGAAARALGYGGVKAVSVASGLSLSTVQTGAREVDEGVEPMEMARAAGAGRKKVEEAQPGLEDALDGLVEPEGGVIRSVRCGGRRSLFGTSPMTWVLRVLW